MVRYAPKDIDEIFMELMGQSDRAAISVGGSMVEYALEQCIKSQLRLPQDKKDEAVLFVDNGIIGTFYEKIWVAYFLRLIGPITRRDLDLIRKIRNSASHDMNPVSFTMTEEIANRCRDLYLPNNSDLPKTDPTNLRLMFILSAQFYSANLLLRSSADAPEASEALKHLAPYLDR